MTALPEMIGQTAAAIPLAWEAREEGRQDKTLRVSSIGNECDRRLWYGFRWAHAPECHPGRVLRLFETGNIEERRLCDDLRAIGCDVLEVDSESGSQFEVAFVGGHLTGHTDGEVSNVPEAPKTPHLLECKSHNDKSFQQLKRHGVQASKPVHYAQMQLYMHGRNLTRALYLAVNKNDDEVWSERIEYDAVFSIAMVARAERIVTSDRAPAKIREDGVGWPCMFCPAKAVCHEGVWSLRNCRTCLHAEPVLDGDATWRCMARGTVLTTEKQREGCHRHCYLPDLVPGEQIDADPEASTVTYRLRDGSTFVDGRQAVAA